MLKKDLARQVLVPNEILKVEAALRCVQGIQSELPRPRVRPGVYGGRTRPGCAETRGLTAAASTVLPLFCMAVEGVR